jgi:hypothetical protein
MNQSSDAYLLSIDSHFHNYQQFNRDDLLDYAFEHLSEGARRINPEADALPVLFLADDIKSTCFDSFNQAFTAHDQDNDSNWHKVSEHQDVNSVLLRKNAMQQMLIIRGHQLITSENLEALVIGCSVSADDEHQPVDDIIQAYKQKALIILPWAVGKWLGKRGQIINKMMEKYNSTDFCLGDNGGRPWIWKKIPQFDKAQKIGFPILRGSDPLPLPGEERQAGHYGFTINGGNMTELTGGSVIKQVRSELEHISEFGRQESLFRFILNQIKLRIQK